jgi:hypothetical protein
VCPEPFSSSALKSAGDRVTHSNNAFAARLLINAKNRDGAKLNYNKGRKYNHVFKR